MDQQREIFLVRFLFISLEDRTQNPLKRPSKISVEESPTDFPARPFEGNIPLTRVETTPKIFLHAQYLVSHDH